MQTAKTDQIGRLPDWADAQADLSLHWVHMQFCCFCLEVAIICCYLL